MMNFQRNQNPAKSLGIGLFQKIPGLVENSALKNVYDYKIYWELLDWAFEEDNIQVFDYIINLNGQLWYNEKIAIIECLHDLLWDAINFNKIVFVKSLLTIPNAFYEKDLPINEEHIQLMIPSNRSRKPKIILFSIGFYYNMAMELECHEIVDMLKNHYLKEKDSK